MYPYPAGLDRITVQMGVFQGIRQGQHILIHQYNAVHFKIIVTTADIHRIVDRE